MQLRQVEPVGFSLYPYIDQGCIDKNACFQDAGLACNETSDVFVFADITWRTWVKNKSQVIRRQGHDGLYIIGIGIAADFQFHEAGIDIV